MLEKKDKEVGDRGYTYRITQLPAKKGRALLVRLVKVLGPVFGALIANMEAEKAPPKVAPTKPDTSKGATARALASIDGKSVAGALGELAARLNEADLDFVCLTLGEYSEVNGLAGEDGQDLSDTWRKLTPAVQEFHFAGNYGELFQWIGAALEVNYSDFFKGSQIGEALTRAAVGESVSPPKDSSVSESPQG